MKWENQRIKSIALCSGMLICELVHVPVLKAKDTDILRSPDVTSACEQVLSLPFHLNGSLNVITTSLALDTISLLIHFLLLILTLN